MLGAGVPILLLFFWFRKETVNDEGHDAKAAHTFALRGLICVVYQHNDLDYMDVCIHTYMHTCIHTK
jgi:hypothetical protein